MKKTITILTLIITMLFGGGMTKCVDAHLPLSAIVTIIKMEARPLVKDTKKESWRKQKLLKKEQRKRSKRWKKQKYFTGISTTPLLIIGLVFLGLILAAIITVIVVIVNYKARKNKASVALTGLKQKAYLKKTHKEVETEYAHLDYSERNRIYDYKKEIHHAAIRKYMLQDRLSVLSAKRIRKDKQVKIKKAIQAFQLRKEKYEKELGAY